jgi:hypothetical protein
LSGKSRGRVSGRRGKRTRIASSGVRRGGWGIAIPTVYDGYLYASKAEARYAQHLDLLKAAKQIKGWERQVKWPLIVNGVRVCGFVPDFKVHLKDGKFKLVEVKGRVSAVWKLKHKLFSALHPNVEYVVVPSAETKNL